MRPCCFTAGLEACGAAGNMADMDPLRHPSNPGSPPILDMTPDGEFRDTVASDLPGGRGGGSWLDRVLARVGGVALLLTLTAGGFLLVALAVLFVGLLLPFVLAAGLVAFGSLWWRLRRLRRQGGLGPGAPPGAGPGSVVRFVVLRR